MNQTHTHTHTQNGNKHIYIHTQKKIPRHTFTGKK